MTLKLLIEYSLVEQNADGESYSIHPVVHDWIRVVVNRNEDDCKPLHTAVATVGLWNSDGREAGRLSFWLLGVGVYRMPSGYRNILS